jgi:hypothetical protein
MLVYMAFENSTLKTEICVENKSHLSTFLEICKDKNLIKCKFNTLNDINIG